MMNSTGMMACIPIVTPLPARCPSVTGVLAGHPDAALNTIVAAVSSQAPRRSSLNEWPS